jgi:methionyl-tRNA formyltransferase
MRIEFLTQDDPLYILPFFEEFFLHYGQEFKILQLSCCPTMGSRPKSQLAQELLWLYGPLGFGQLVGRAALGQTLGLIRRPPGSKHYHSLRQVCRAYDVPLRHIGNPNDAEFIDAFRARGPELLVSVACPYILKDRLLTLPPLGCINIHHAPLPGYKGMMPTFWQMFHGERSVGVSIHAMVARIDEGAILLQESLPIQSGESLDSLIRRSKRHGAHCMARVLRAIQSGTPPTPQPPVRPSSYFTFPKHEEIAEFHRRGFRAI